MPPKANITYTLTIALLTSCAFCCSLSESVSVSGVFPETVLIIVTLLQLLLIPLYSMYVVKKYFLSFKNITSSLTLIVGRMLPAIFAGLVVGMHVSSYMIFYYLDVNYWFLNTADYAILQLCLVLAVMVLPHLSQLYRQEQCLVISTPYYRRFIAQNDIIRIKKCFLAIYCLQYKYQAKERKVFFLPSIQLIGKLPSETSLEELENGNQVSYRFSRLAARLKATLFCLLYL